MTDIVHDLSPSTIPLTIDANKQAYGAFLSTFPQGAFYSDQEISWFETGIPLALFNGVLQTHLEPDALPAAIDRVCDHFQQRACPFQWRVGPASQPANLGERLVAHGIEHDEDEPGMALDLQALNEDIPAATDIDVHPVTSHELLAQWARVWGCGAPEVVIQQWLELYSGLDLGPQSPLRFYLGTRGGQPVATSALFFGAGVASIEHVVTLPEVRRQGIGAAMTLLAAREARAQGYRLAVLTASPLGINTYRRLGFQEYCTFSTYEWHPS